MGGMGGGGSNLTEKLMLQMMLRNANNGSQQQQQNQPNRFGYNNFDRFNPERPHWQRGDMASHPKYRTKPWRYFAAGGCKNGDRCTFLHDPNYQPGHDDFVSHRE